MRKGELNISDKTYAAFTKLAGYQIIGAFIGLAIVAWAVYKREEVDTTGILLFSLIVLLYLYSLFCGIKCIQAKSNALKYSLVNQCFQIIGFAMFGFTFSFVAGLYLNFNFNLVFGEGFNFNFGFGISNFALVLNGETETLTVNINLIAIGIIIWIVALMKRVKAEIDFEKAEEIGTDMAAQHIEN